MDIRHSCPLAHCWCMMCRASDPKMKIELISTFDQQLLSFWMELLGGALHAQPDQRNTYHGTCRLHENAVIRMVNSDLTILCTLTLTLPSLILIPQLILLQVKWRENSCHFYLWFSYWQKVQQVCIHWVLLCMNGIVEGLRLMFIFW